jgi:phage shock protein PspC (stress-responsive transcriptional regulator)
MADRKNSSSKRKAETPSKANFSRLYRSEKNKMIAGVAGCLGEFFGVDPSIIRLLFVLIILFGGSGILLYIVLWIILPTESAVKGSAEDHVKANVEEIRTRAESFASDLRGEQSSSDNRTWLGLLIIILGAFFLFSSFGLLQFFDWGRFWPLLLIIFGIFILTRGK